MKKSMFITSVIMVVVLAIALPTSSLAWINGAAGAQKVTAGSLTVEAMEAAAGKGLVISADGVSFGINDVSLGTAVDGMTPAAPLSCPGTNVPAELTASIATAQNFGNVVKIPGATNDTVKKADVKISVSNTFYVASTGVAVEPIIDVVFENTEDEVGGAIASEPVLWVAVLAYNEAESAWQIVKIAASQNMQMTTFKGADSDLPVDSGVLSELATTIDASGAWEQIELAAAGDNAWGTAVQYKAVAWFDGSTLINSNSGCSCSYKITFTDPNA